MFPVRRAFAFSRLSGISSQIQFTNPFIQRRLASKKPPKVEPGTNAQGQGFKAAPLAEDPRPPWVYQTTGILMYSGIPFALIYCVFFLDFGEQEHVFAPVRRWATRQKAALFELSPAEKEMLNAEAAEKSLSAGATGVDSDVQ